MLVDGVKGQLKMKIPTDAERAKLGDVHFMPLISVITVVYNGVNEIESTIQSYLAQERNGCEYIVVDGNSTDGTQEVLRKYSDQIDQYISESDKGVYDAMNKGLALAKGRWIYYLNCGDLLASPDVLKDVSPILQTSTSPLVAGFVLVDGDSVSSKRFPLPALHKISARELFRRHFCHQALFITREAYLVRGGFDLSYPIFADFEMCWKILSTTGGLVSIDLDIARFDLNGISSDYRESLNIYRESEKIFSNAMEGRPALQYWVGAARAVAHKYKRILIERLK